MRTVLAVLLSFAILGTLAAAEQKRKKPQRGWSYPPVLDGAHDEVYKTVGDVKLKIYIFTPEGHKAGDRRPAIVFFFGGGWQSGSPAQFEAQCKYFASRGMVAMTADYRVASRHGVKALQCVADAKSAVRWIRANAERLGVDPNRVAAGGGSAGGHVAACTGTIPGLDEPGENTAVSSKPDCMVLFNPALVLAPVPDKIPFPEGRIGDLGDRLGIEPEKLSPYHHVDRGDPPAIVFHGTADTTVPFRTAEIFAEKMQQAGNLCKLVPFEGRAHGFFNFGRGDNKDFVATVRMMDEFLSAQGFLDGKPTIK